jgi:hypothetical protein
MKSLALFLSATALALVVTGCARGGAYQPQNTAKYNIEDAATFVLLDKSAQRSVTSPGIQQGRTADGRLKVTAKLRNRENRRIEVQANCTFKDAQGFTLDETPYRTVILDENATHDVTFETFNKDAVRYTVHVRQAR